MNIWWIRRDLRLKDNPALTASLAEGAGLLPVFILDDRLLEASPSTKRKAFLFDGLRALDADLRRLGSRLILRRGNPADQLSRLAAECGAERVFAEEDYSPYAIRRDQAVSRQMDLHLVQGLSVHHPAVIKQLNGKPFTVFTPYSRAWKALPFSSEILPAPTALPPVPALFSETIPEAAPSPFQAGEQQAHQRLQDFISDRIFDYAEGRNRLDFDGTSVLSPYLRFGMISARQAASAAIEAERSAPDAGAKSGCATWLNELIWREFYQSILYHFPEVHEQAFRSSMRNLAWRNDLQALKAWQSGLTGYPVVDAGMRQLAATGWMHNRARMITASFLVKHLLIDWREGERWFFEHLVDGDPASNNGGWQWVAGTGTDAVPYFRIFNPVLQSQKFDPEGAYIRRWVPELANVPLKYIHTPWEMPAETQAKTGVSIGGKYPAPIVDHQIARQRALEFYSKG